MSGLLFTSGLCLIMSKFPLNFGEINMHDVLMLPQAAAAGKNIGLDIFFFMIFMIAVHKALLKAPPDACVLKF